MTWRSVVIALCGAVGGIMMMQLFGYISDVRYSIWVAHAALTEADAVTLASGRALAIVGEAAESPCDEADLRRLKRLVYATSYVVDAGRISSNAIQCTATWGKLQKPIPLGSPDYASGDVAVWNNKAIPQWSADATNLLARSGGIIVTSTSLFADADSAYVSRIRIRTANGATVFKEIAPRKSRNDASSYVVHSERCSATTNICADAWSPVSTLLSMGIARLLLGAAAGGTLLVVVARLLARFRASASLASKLRKALRRRELSVVYQPIFRLADGKLAGYEALARWRTTDDGPIAPDVFIPLAVKEGLSASLALHVLRTSLRDMANALSSNEGVHLSVNIEPYDLSNATFRDSLLATCREAGVPMHQIRLEITERSDIEHPSTLRHMAELRQAGLAFIVDDFGTGSANLSHLSKLTFDGIKIDRLFTAAVATASPLEAILPAVYRVARGLGLEVTVEGVETEAQATALRTLAPDCFVQGWYFAREEAAPCEPAPGRHP